MRSRTLNVMPISSVKQTVFKLVPMSMTYTCVPLVASMDSDDRMNSFQSTLQARSARKPLHNIVSARHSLSAIQ